MTEWGSMQALIDFEGWCKWRGFSQPQSQAPSKPSGAVTPKSPTSKPSTTPKQSTTPKPPTPQAHRSSSPSPLAQATAASSSPSAINNAALSLSQAALLSRRKSQLQRTPVPNVVGANTTTAAPIHLEELRNSGTASSGNALYGYGSGVPPVPSIPPLPPAPASTGTADANTYSNAETSARRHRRNNSASIVGRIMRA